MGYEQSGAVDSVRETRYGKSGRGRKRTGKRTGGAVRTPRHNWRRSLTTIITTTTTITAMITMALLGRDLDQDLMYSGTVATTAASAVRIRLAVVVTIDGTDDTVVGANSTGTMGTMGEVGTVETVRRERGEREERKCLRCRREDLTGVLRGGLLGGLRRVLLVGRGSLLV